MKITDSISTPEYKKRAPFQAEIIVQFGNPPTTNEAEICIIMGEMFQLRFTHDREDYLVPLQRHYLHVVGHKRNLWSWVSLSLWWRLV